MRIRLALLALMLCLNPPQVAGQATASTPSFSLKPGDVVDVFLWRERDLSGEYPVDERGNVVFPVIGTRAVTGAP